MTVLPFVPIGNALDFLRTGDPEALTAWISSYRYSREQLDELRDRMAAAGVRVRYQIDWGLWKWIEDLRNYRFEHYYGWFIATSIHTYAADRLYGPKSYLDHLEVETASVLDAPIKAEPNQTREAPGRRRGAPPKYHWSDLKTEAFRLMDYHGEFSSDDEDWNAQERLVEKLQEFYENKFGAEPKRKRSHQFKPPSSKTPTMAVPEVGNMPAKSTLNENIPSWLNEWRHRRQPKT